MHTKEVERRSNTVVELSKKGDKVDLGKYGRDNATERHRKNILYDIERWKGTMTEKEEITSEGQAGQA